MIYVHTRIHTHTLALLLLTFQAAPAVKMAALTELDVMVSLTPPSSRLFLCAN